MTVRQKFWWMISKIALNGFRLLSRFISVIWKPVDDQSPFRSLVTSWKQRLGMILSDLTILWKTDFSLAFFSVFQWISASLESQHLSWQFCQSRRQTFSYILWCCHLFKDEVCTLFGFVSRLHTLQFRFHQLNFNLKNSLWNRTRSPPFMPFLFFFGFLLALLFLGSMHLVK